MKQNHLELKQARIPLRIINRLAFKNIWKKKFRFLAMMIICSISLAFLSFTIELNGDILRQNVYTTVENGYRFTDVYKKVETTKEQQKENPYNAYAYTEFNTSVYEDIKKDVEGIVVHEYNDVAINYAKNNLEDANYFYTGYINTIIRYDETNHYDLICGRLPRASTKEILVTDYLIEAFKYFNIYPSCDTIYDYLNMHLDLTNNKDYIITGIIKTNYDKWTKYSNIETVEVSDKENYAYTNDFKFMNSVILNKEYFDLEQGNMPKYLSITNRNGNYPTSLGYWEITSKKIDGNATSYKGNASIGIAYNQLTLLGSTRYGIPFGRNPINDDEIIIPTSIVDDLLGIDWNIKQADLKWWNIGNYYKIFEEQIYGKEITLHITSKTDGTLYEKTFKICGLSEASDTICGSISPLMQVTSQVFQEIYYHYNTFKENILVELPKSSEKAYNLFLKAASKGYILNVWAYRADIDSYTIDPFMDLVSKAGLFIFAAFTMGIMWTILSIEIVDSKKEIGIMRSIGLSGFKVSLIFIIQTCFVVFISYIFGLLISYQLVPYYNSGITDELNKITLYMYTYTYRSPLYLFIFVVIMMIISTILPLTKIMNSKIIDIINERDK